MVDVAPPGSAASESVTASTEDAEYTEDFFDSAEFLEEEEEEGEEEEERFISIFEILDAPRELPEPVELTEEHLKQVADELGIITLCWPELEGVEFENRVNFPMSYLKNSDKEKLLLLYAENFRRQFVHQYPDRKQLMLACENECGVQKMVCTTIRSTTLPYPEIETWQDCASFIGDHMKYEPLQIPTLFPNNLYSPHTTFLRQSGHCYALSTALCSLLLGLGYNAFVVSGYATEDVTKKIMTRVDSPFPEKEETTEEKEEEQIVSKYVLRPPRDLRSKFLLAMEQRELDKMKAEEERIAEERRKLMEELEQPPFDELYGLRVHSWVLLLPGGRSVESPVFLEPSKGSNHPVDSPLYCGVESVWNNENYWVNMQDCRLGLGAIDYDFTNVNNWEHVLAGEPLETRKKQVTMEEYEEDAGSRDDSLDEKHLDMPISWSLKISIPHEVLKSRFPDGKKVTMYKRTKVEEFAEYVQYDGLVTKISRFDDMECEGDTSTVEEIYKNRQDCLDKILRDCETQKVTEYFRSGREDGMKVLIYNENELNAEDDVVIEFYHKARHDGLARLDLSAVHMTETYEDREDFFYYRHIDYAKRGCPPPGMIEGNRRIVVRVIEKFHRNEKIPASTDVAIREFAIIDREIHLQYHYDKGKVTASTRDFIKPPIAEMGESMRFNPELTCGYQAEIGAKPPRQLQLFKLFEKELSDEEKTMTHIREMEDEIADMLQQREVEKAFPKLQVSLYNREQNKENLQGMLERERRMKEHRVKEIEEDIDYLAPYAARQGIPEKTVMTVLQGRNAKERCMEDFKRLLIDRANNIQYQFEHLSKQLQDKQIWYITVQDSMKPEEEEAYFEELNRMIFFLHTLELRLARHRDLSPLRYEALRNYLYADNRLSALRDQEYLAIGTQTEKNENKTRNNNAKNH